MAQIVPSSSVKKKSFFVLSFRFIFNAMQTINRNNVAKKTLPETIIGDGSCIHLPNNPVAPNSSTETCADISAVVCLFMMYKFNIKKTLPKLFTKAR